MAKRGLNTALTYHRFARKKWPPARGVPRGAHFIW